MIETVRFVFEDPELPQMELRAYPGQDAVELAQRLVQAVKDGKYELQAKSEEWKAL